MIQYISYLFFTIVGLIFMKLGKGQMNIHLEEGMIYFHIGYKILLALFFYCTSFVLWIGIVGKSDISYIVPITSAILNGIVVIVGFMIFKESISLYKILGIAFATFGVILMNIK